jgi:trimeric autotransporter adhesin
MRALLQTVPSLLFLLLGLTATAQCTPQWQAGDAIPHVRGNVYAAVTWDPDGAGPLPLQLVVGGAFSAGTMTSTRIATYDGSQWAPLGTPPGAVTRLYNWNGQLVANCISSSSPIGTICVWNGSVWQQLGSAPGFVYALSSYNGDLVVGGFFTSIAGVAANSIARWNGSSWSPLGTGTFGTVRAMTVYNNLLHIGGTFNNVGGVAVGNMAAWNGVTWLSTAAFNGTVEALGVRSGIALTQYQLFAAGNFTTVGVTPAQHIARFTASTSTWTAMGTGLPGNTATAMFVATSGLSSYDVTVAVDAPGSNQKVWRWNGTAWVNLGAVVDTSGDVTPTCLSNYNGQPVLGLLNADQNARRYDGVSEWLPVRGPGIAGRTCAIDANGSDLVIGGQFTTINGATVNNIARGGPGNWQPLGTGVDPTGVVNTIARTGNGDVIAGGSFTTAGGVAVNNIARWNGTAWASLGAGLNGSVYALRVLANGDLIATGAFTAAGATSISRIARWNGTTWSGLGLGLSAQGNALALAANGDLIVGGNFLIAGGVTCNRIARWNGTTWSALGVGFDNAVFAVAVLPDGSIAAGGHFQTSGAATCPYVALWNGSAWAAPVSVFFRPNNDVYTLLALPDGDLVAGGPTWTYSLSFPPIYVNTTIARLDDITWRSLQARGLAVWALAQRPNGTLVAGGDFFLDSQTISDNLAQLVPPCPATANSYGAGCSGAGGANTLVATELPWLGGTYRGLATGMPSLGFAVTVTGLAPLALPIAAILPQGLPGCSALVTPDVLDLAIPTGGLVTTQLAIPNTASLVGAQVRQQVAPFETNLGGAVTAITSTNALLITIGVL